MLRGQEVTSSLLVSERRQGRFISSRLSRVDGDGRVEEVTSRLLVSERTEGRFISSRLSRVDGMVELRKCSLKVCFLPLLEGLAVVVVTTEE